MNNIGKAEAAQWIKKGSAMPIFAFESIPANSTVSATELLSLPEGPVGIVLLVIAVLLLGSALNQLGRGLEPVGQVVIAAMSVLVGVVLVVAAAALLLGLRLIAYSE